MKTIYSSILAVAIILLAIVYAYDPLYVLAYILVLGAMITLAHYAMPRHQQQTFLNEKTHS